MEQPYDYALNQC